jgi:glycosyltransferase involved in cell wall biosynthesis
MPVTDRSGAARGGTGDDGGSLVERDGEALPERHLFIAGCPRSGTSALVFLLNEHPRIALGFERFKRTRALLDPWHFTPAQFFAPVLAETDIQGELLYRRLRERWRGGSVEVIGDKVPLYWRVLPDLLERFSHGRLILLVREPYDVAASFDRRAADTGDWWPAANDRTLALTMWNEALERVRAAERAGYGERIFLVPYEGLLAGEERWLDALLAFLSLQPTARLRAEHRRLAERWRTRERQSVQPELVAEVEASRDAELSAWAEERMRCQLRLPRPFASEDAEGSFEGSPLDDEQLAEREVEREQLLAQMRRAGSRVPGEADVLDRRVLDQSRELVRRGEALRRAAAGGQGRAVSAARRVTFILPHQRHTTGGVYAIEQFAHHLAAQLDVAAVVRDSEVRPIAGVRVTHASKLDADALGAGSVLVYPADMRDAAQLLELPAEVGRPVMLFQGYGTPGSPVVRANLERGAQTIATARWLVPEALSYGAACTHVPYGLDRELFVSGPPPRERAPRVSLMTHHLDWKGLADALAAVALVRSARPDVEVVCFGVEPVHDADVYLPSPTRAEIAALQRTCAVHIVASWEEGFGMTGAEAIASGAALATTDTRGSRDYALHERTALVSRPRDPLALAQNVLKLLDDAELRERLVLTGQRYLDSALPSWPEAARRMRFALFGD